MRAALLLALAISSATSGYAQDTLLRESQLTEAAVVNALAADDAGAAPKTRGFKPGLRTAESATAATAGPRKASLLIAFDTASAVLTPQAKNAVDVVGRALQSERLATLVFTVEGHADPRGGEEYNNRLSQQRAEAVVAYLVEQHHIARDRLVAQGKGASELMNTKNPDAVENRRVSIVTNAR